MPDQEVCLGEAAFDCTKVYTVVGGDTCEWIQEMYGMTPDALWSNNPQINAECNNIYIGEVLCVDTETMNYPPYNATAYEQVAQTYLPFCDEL
jgi:LysM repeat protein